MNMLTVKDLISNMVTWQQSRYLDPGVWGHFRSEISPEALPTNISSLQLPAPPDAPHPLQLAFMVSTLYESLHDSYLPTPTYVCLDSKYPDNNYLFLLRTHAH